MQQCPPVQTIVMSIILQSKPLPDQKPFSKSFLGDTKSDGRIVRSSREVAPNYDTLNSLNDCEVQNSQHDLIRTELLFKRNLLAKCGINRRYQAYVQKVFIKIQRFCFVCVPPRTYWCTPTRIMECSLYCFFVYCSDGCQSETLIGQSSRVQFEFSFRAFNYTIQFSFSFMCVTTI
jgi:hypothetical protein